MSDIRLKKITIEPGHLPLTISGGDVYITNTSDSSSVLDGALVLNGGIGINTTFDSISSTAGGSLTVGGGVAVMKNIFIGKDLCLDNASGIVSVDGLSEKRFFIDSITNKNCYIAPDGVNKRVDVYDTKVLFNISTPSTSINDAAVCIIGGIGIGCTTDVSDINNGGALTVAGGMALAKNLHVGKSLTVGETNSNEYAIKIMYTGEKQIELQNNASGSAYINVDNTNLITSNSSDIIFESQYGNMDFVNDGQVNVSVKKQYTELINNVFVSNTTESFNATTGSLVMNGGLSISCTTDAINTTSGGSFTTLGGLGVAKKIFTGDAIGINETADQRNKLVLWNSVGSLNESILFTGLGTVSSGSLIYQVDSTSGNHIFYAAENSSSSNKLVSFSGNGDVTFALKSQSYSIRGGGLNNDGMSFQSDVGSSNVNFFTYNGEVTSTNELCVFAKGLPNDVANSEYLKLGWNGTKYIISSNRTGSGELHDVIMSNGIENQLLLTTNGNVILESDLTSTNSTTGCLVLQNGGLSIGSTSNSLNYTNGGALTVAGGGAFAKDLAIGGHVVLGESVNVELSCNLTNGTYSSLILKSSQDLYPNLRLVGDTSVYSSEYPVRIDLFSLGDSNTVDNQYLTIGVDDSLSNYIIKSESSGSGAMKPLVFNSDQLILQTSGNIGIHTTNPIYNLHINGTFYTNDIVLFDATQGSINSTTATLVVNGGISVFNTINSTSVTSGGALTIAGGASFEKDLFVGGVSNFINTKPSDSIDSASIVISGGVSIMSTENAVNLGNGGCLTIGGGASIGGDLYVGGSINGGGTSTSTYAYLTLTATDEAINLSSGSLITFGGITIQAEKNAISTSDGGSFLTNGGASIGKDVYIGGKITLTNDVIDFYTTNDSIINFYDSFNIKRFSIDKYNATQSFSITRYDSLGNFIEKSIEINNTNGNVIFNNTQYSSDSNTASVVFKGGISISNTINASSLQNGGSLTLAGGASIGKDVYMGGNVSILSSTQSDDVSTGALLISGGVGVSGNINVLGNAVIVGNLTVRGETTTVDTNNVSVKDNILILNSGPSGTNDSGFVINRYQQDNNIGSGDIVSDVNPPETYTLPDQTGMNTSQLKLTINANAINDYYVGWWIKISSGFSNNQVRRITSYNGTTKIATISSPWLNQNPSIGDVVMMYNKPYVGIIYSETHGRFDFGSTTQSPDQSSVILSDRIPICYSSAVSVSTDVSTNVSSGALLMSGGISICNTVDSQSITSGGTFTTLGGASIAKTLRVGSSLYVNGTDMTPSQYDMFSIRTTSALNNQSSFVNISDLLFDNNVWGFDLYLTANLVATNNLYTNFHIRGINKGNEWEIVKTYVGSDTGIEFNITNFGQLQYTTPNYNGFVSLTFRWRALVT